MILKNARHLLPEAIDALAPLASEIGQYVFVDTGSEDKSAAYLRERLPTAEIVPYVWDDDFAEARNVALDHVKTPWALFLDADERLANESVPVLQKILKQLRTSSTAKTTPEGIICHRENLDLEGTVISWDALTRLLAVCPHLRFAGRVHERPVYLQPPNKARPLRVQRYPELRILHLGLQPQARQTKTDYYLRLIQKERERFPSPLMDYHWATTSTIQKTVSAQARLVCLQQALKETLAFEQNPAPKLPYPQWAGVPIAACILECQFLLIEAGQRAKMLEFFEAHQPEALLAESWGQAALAYDQEGQWHQAQHGFYTALNPQYPMADPSQGWGSWRSHAFLAILYARAGDGPAAWAHGVQALKGNPLPEFARAMQNLQENLAAQMSLARAQSVLKKAFQHAYEVQDSAALLSLSCFLLSLDEAGEERILLKQWPIPAELHKSPFYAWFCQLLARSPVN